MSGSIARRGSCSLSPVFLGRVLESVTAKSASPENPVALEHLGSWTGNKLSNEEGEEARFESSGIAFRTGDVLFGKLRPYLAKVWVASAPGTAVGDFLVLRSQTMLPEYLKYLLLDQGLISYLSAVSYGAKMPRTSWDQLRSIKRTVPESAAQLEVVDFLDHETAQIDELIAKQEQLVEVLEERLKSHWAESARSLAERYGTLRMGRAICSIVDGPFGSALTSAHYSESGTRVVRLGNIGINEFLDHEAVFIPDEYAEQLAAHRLEAGDVVVAGLGDEAKPLGRATVIPSGFGPAIVKADCYRVRPHRNMRADFLAWVLSSSFAAEQISYLGRGSTRQRLNTKSVQEVRVPLPPISVQDALLSEFNVMRTRHDALVQKATQMIALLKERRQALISAAVTGKIDVTGKV